MSASPEKQRRALGRVRFKNAAVAEELAGKGFTVRQLLLFHSSKGIGEFMTTGDVVKHIVIPETAEFQTCYMDSPFMKQHGGRQAATKLVSHAWRSRFSTTVINILLEASGLAWTELRTLVLSPSGVLDADRALRKLGKQVLAKAFWLCIFAVNQHLAICGDCWDCHPQTSEEFAAKKCKCGRAKFNPCRCGALKYQPDDNLYEIDKFPKVVELLEEGLVVALDPELTALTRLWVVAEIWEASSTKDVVLRAASGLDDDAQEKLRHRKELFPPVAQCDASSSEDKRRILGKIGNQDYYNDFVWSYTELCFGACHRLATISSGAKDRLNRLSQLEIQCSWNETMESTSDLELGAHFEILKGLRRLVVDISHLARLIDVQSLAEGLSKLKQLESLTLKLKGCIMLADVSPIGASFAELQALQKLHIQLPGGGLTQLGTSLAGLRSLNKLHLEDVHSVPQLQLSSMAGCAPCTSLTKLRSLQVFTVTFKRCVDLTDVSNFSIILNSLLFLRELSLDLEGCTSLVDLSILGNSLEGLYRLQKLRLDWSSLSLENLSALKSLAQLRALKEVHLAFKECSKLEDISALGIIFAELGDLEELTLNFQACTKLVELSKFRGGLLHLQNLRRLCLDFCGCVELADVSSLGETLVELKALQKIRVDFSECHQIPLALRRRFEDRAALSLLGQEIPPEDWESRTQPLPDPPWRRASSVHKESSFGETPSSPTVAHARTVPSASVGYPEEVGRRRQRAKTETCIPSAQEGLALAPVSPPLACLPERRGAQPGLRSRSHSTSPPPPSTPEASAALPHRAQDHSIDNREGIAFPAGAVARPLPAEVDEALRRIWQLEQRRAQLLRGADFGQLVHRKGELENQVSELENIERQYDLGVDRDLEIKKWLRQQEDQGSPSRSTTAAASPPFRSLLGAESLLSGADVAHEVVDVDHGGVGRSSAC